MVDLQQAKSLNLDPNQKTNDTESGELERPQVFRRKIDCGGRPEIADRRNGPRGGRRRDDIASGR